MLGKDHFAAAASQAAEHTVAADRTCTFVAAKAGFSASETGQYLGQLHIVSIGIPPRLIREMACSARLQE